MSLGPPVRTEADCSHQDYLASIPELGWGLWVLNSVLGGQEAPWLGHLKPSELRPQSTEATSSRQCRAGKKPLDVGVFRGAPTLSLGCHLQA